MPTIFSPQPPEIFIAGKLINGVTFDLEGTITGREVEELHFAGHRAAAEAVNLELPPNDDMEMLIRLIPNFIGGPDEVIHMQILALADTKGTWSATTANARTKKLEELLKVDLETFRRLRDQLPNIPPREGFLDFLSEVKCAGIPVSIGSLTNKEDALALIVKMGLDKHFDPDKIVLGEHVARRKPAPDVYLETAKRMRIDPSKQLVFEDSHNGLIAAWDAGSWGIGMPTIWKPEIIGRMRDKGRAIAVFESWTDVNLNRLRSIEGINRSYEGKKPNPLGWYR